MGDQVNDAITTEHEVVIAFQRERLNILSGPTIPARVDASR